MVVLQDVTKVYRARSGQVRALDGISLEIEQGQFVGIGGPSGSGKTTLLMALAGMLRPSAGTVRVGPEDIYKLSTRDRATFRARTIGFVFQMFHLVPYLNVLENVVLASGVLGGAKRSAEAAALLGQLGLEGRALHKPAELSAGEKQRTAIARALLNRPGLVLADEPTGNLDPDNARTVLRYLSDFQRGGGTVIVATHGPAVEEFATRMIRLRDGKIEEVGR